MFNSVFVQGVPKTVDNLDDFGLGYFVVFLCLFFLEKYNTPAPYFNSYWFSVKQNIFKIVVNFRSQITECFSVYVSRKFERYNYT